MDIETRILKHVSKVCGHVERGDQDAAVAHMTGLSSCMAALVMDRLSGELEDAEWADFLEELTDEVSEEES
jgi:hypothetical protein